MVCADPRPLVFLAATPFDSVLSGRTRRLAEQLSACGRDVIFVELPSARSAVRAFPHFGPAKVPGSTIGVVRLCPLPAYLRLVRTPVARWWNTYAIGRLKRWIPMLERSVLVTSTPWWSEIAQSLPCTLRCYDYIDHVSVQAGPGRGDLFAEWDHALLRASDMVTTVSEPLRADVVRRFDADRVFLIPNGVPSDWFDRDVEPISRSLLTPHPGRVLAGFLGSLFEWVDIDLLVRIARRLPHVEFAFIGPQRRGVDLGRLNALTNVRVLPAVAFAEVPRWIKAFDVCLIPFKHDVISECADPLKLYEYCALGKPVISTVPFRVEGQPAPIIVADDADAFAHAIERAAAEDVQERCAERIASARRQTWERRAGDFERAVETVLRSRSR